MLYPRVGATGTFDSLLLAGGASGTERNTAPGGRWKHCHTLQVVATIDQRTDGAYTKFYDLCEEVYSSMGMS